ncbi:MAG: hypothetical protein DRJ65_02590 [Acidobacteria bacterium]|nr:MAG: hypothetical protein DRJ65_02590 [Acidobacteriota bacterium]
MNTSALPSQAAWLWRTATLLFAGALIVRVFAVTATGFDGLYGQDAYAYFDQAMALRATLLQGIPAPPGFHWPQGYPALVALMSLAVGGVPIAAQLVSLVMGSLVAPLTYLVGRKLLPSGGDGAAILAAVLTAIGGQAVLSSIVSMSDATALALILLSMWTALEFATTPRRRCLLALAVVFGCAAVATRWASILVAPALAVPALRGLAYGRRLRHIFPALLAAALGSGAVLFTLFHNQAFDLMGYFRNWNLLNAVWGPIPEIPAGTLSAKAPGLLYYLAPLYHPAFLGPLLGPLAGWGLWRLWRDNEPYRSLTLVLWAGVPFFFFVGLPLRNLRFCLTNAVPFILLAAWGAWILLPRPFLGKAIRVVIGLSLALIVAWGARRIESFTSAARAIIHTVHSVEALVPAHAIVLTFEITQTFEHHSDLQTFELFDQNEATLGMLIKGGRPVFLLTQPDDVIARWQNQAPGINTRWLEDHGSLQEIEAWGLYTLRRFEEHCVHQAGFPRAEAAS